MVLFFSYYIYDMVQLQSQIIAIAVWRSTFDSKFLENVMRFFFLSIQFLAIFFQAQIFAFLTPKMDSLTPKTWEKSPNNIEIGPNFTYPVSRGLETGLAVAKAPHLIKLRHR